MNNKFQMVLICYGRTLNHFMLHFMTQYVSFLVGPLVNDSTALSNIRVLLHTRIASATVRCKSLSQVDHQVCSNRNPKLTKKA